MDDIETKLFKLEDDLLAVDFSSVDEFNGQWYTFADRLKATIASQPPSGSAMKTAHFIAQRVSQVAQSLLDLDIIAEKLTKTLLDEATPPTSTIVPPKSSRKQFSCAAIPSCIKLCHTWLLENLHNPYPSARLRDSIAHQSGVLRKDIDKWFSDSRTRIGWNSARKRLFSNKRTEIVDAATGFFTKASPKWPIDFTIERTFTSIKKRAMNLCDDVLSGSSSSIELVNQSRELTLPTKVKPPGLPQLSPRQSNCESYTYPSPEHSPKNRNFLTLERQDDVSSPDPIPLVGCKRRGPFADPDDEGEILLDHRPIKRSKFGTPPISWETAYLSTGLPSPVPSCHETQCLPEVPTPLPVVRNRKRRLSDSSSEVSPKRPRNLSSIPCVQTVSNPLPSSSVPPAQPALNDWTQPNFNVTTLNIEELDPLALDIEWGSLPELDFQSTTDSDGGSPDSQLALELPRTKLVSILNEGGNLSQSSDSFTVDNLPLLFDSPGVNIFEHRPELPIPLRPFDLDLSDDLFFKPSFPSFETSVSSFDSTWNLLGSTSTDSVFDSAQQLDEIPPVIELPPISDSDYFSSQVRGEKEKRLREVHEEARRLELELLTTA